MTGKFKNNQKKKRYYWLQLKTDFFDQKEIKLLRRIAGGDTFTIIYLKMLLLSLRDEGKLFFEAIADDFSEEIALSLDESPDDVALTIAFLESKGLLEIVENDEYLLNRVPEMVGSEAYSTERSRRHRANKKMQETLQTNANTLQCDISATNSNTAQLRDREEIELELENKNIISGKPVGASSSNSEVYSEIISYLNEKIGTSYRSTTKKTQAVIDARLNEGFTVDDFKQVIDTKSSEWMNRKDMAQYLRPETLFSNKFEGYLNQKAVEVKGSQSFNTRDADYYSNDVPF